MLKIAVYFVIALHLILLTELSIAQPSVELVRIPDNGVHPRIIKDDLNNLHFLYFRPGNPNSNSALGNLYYRQYDSEGQAWGEAVKVSNQSFAYRDPIFRADLTLDNQGRVHVVWFQDKPSRFFYTRSNSARKKFEKQRSMVSKYKAGIDAGSDIAANGEKIVIVWAAGDLAREDQRTVYLRQSNDFGETFDDEIEVGDPSLGACGCCGLAAEFDKTGQLILAYRSATKGTGRNMQVLSVNLDSTERAQNSYSPLHALRRWELSSCPVTTNDMVKDGTGNVWLIHENRGRIVQEELNGNTSPRLVSREASKTRQKHPTMAFNKQGYQLVAWGEGGGFFSGGSLRWLLFDSNGKQVAQLESDAVEIPDRSFIAAMEKPDGNFIILY